jgi:NhaP-type Na+/H+ or K+/H+ antiporter
MLFGMMLVPAALPLIGATELLYAILSLTLIRMLPIMLLSAGTGESLASKSFLAWFGPRGLASLAFATMVWSEPISGGNTLVAVTILTVGISLVVHGLTAKPFAPRLADMRCIRVIASTCRYFDTLAAAPFAVNIEPLSDFSKSFETAERRFARIY